jgi:thiosulfate/3-mercaptopyruvate sulfurtransferase
MTESGYTTLIDAPSLAAMLEGEPHDLVLLDTRFDLARPASGRQMFEAAHLPGARFADLDQDLSGPITAHSGRHPLPDPHALAARLRAFGVNRTSQIVAYDAGSGAFAARLWWLARWLGHHKAAVLDGGLARWTALGLPLEDTPPAAGEPGDFDTAGGDDTAWLSSEAVEEGLRNDRLIVLDARAAERFAGLHEPIDPVAGHVPGALSLPFEQMLQADGTFLPPGELATRLRAVVGERTSDRVVAMCGSGVTACHLLLGMVHAGLDDARLYAGSWSEWIRDPARAIARDE